MRRMANIAHDFLLIVASEGIEGIGNIILRGKNIHPVLPELLDARNPPAVSAPDRNAPALPG